MSAATTTPRSTATTTPAGRVGALGRAELTLLWRNRTAMATALFLPFGMVLGLRPAFAQLTPRDTGLGTGALTMTAGIGFVLVFVVYYNLVTAYVARREELVLKRLRTGEATDLEILTGTALPALAVALAQCAVLVASGALLPGLAPPKRPELLLAGVLLGCVLMAALAAVSTVFTPSVELAQLTTVPLILVATTGSGLVLPLGVMPKLVGEGCRLLPMTPVMDLVRAAWAGGSAAAPGAVLRSIGLALVWTVLAGWAARRWFRWEPRR
jgi:ABC-2 type transport system permease protein